MKRELNTREAYVDDMMLSVFKEEGTGDGEGFASL